MIFHNMQIEGCYVSPTHAELCSLTGSQAAVRLNYHVTLC